MANEVKLQNAPGSVASIVLGICSIATGCLVVGLVLGIIGLVQAKKANAIMAEMPAQYGGAGFTKAGKITSIIGIVVGALSIFYWIWVLVIAAEAATVASSMYW